MSIHYCLRIRLIFIAAFALIAACTSSDEQASDSSDFDATMDTLETAKWRSQNPLHSF